MLRRKGLPILPVPEMKNFALGLVAGVILTAALASTQPHDPTPQCTYPIRISRWIDGDTAIADIYLGFDLTLHDQHIRLARVNTPEKGQDDFQAATDLSAHTCPVNSIQSLAPRGKEKYGRILAELTCSGRNLNNALRERGWKNSAR